MGPDNGRHAKQFCRLCVGSAILLTVLLVYGSLLPLDFRYVSSDEFYRCIANGSQGALFYAEGGDTLVNVYLYIPLGILWHLAAVSSLPRANALLRFLATVLLVAILSSSIEVAQIWTKSRICSLADLTCNCAGGITGALLLMPCYAIAVRAGAYLKQSAGIPKHAVRTLLTAYYAYWLGHTFGQDAPPFHASSWQTAENFSLLYAFQQDLLHSYERMALLKFMLFAAPIGFLSAALARGSRLQVSGFGLGAAGIVILELAKALHRFSPPEGGNIIAGLIAVFSGALVEGGVHLLANPRVHGRTSRVGTYVAWLVLRLLAVGALAAFFWFPMNVDWSLISDPKRVGEAFALPFAGEQAHSYEGALVGSVCKFVLFFAVAFGAVLSDLAKYRARLLAYVDCTVLVAAGVLIEAGQVVLSDHTASLGDILVYWAGISVGAAVAFTLYRRFEAHSTDASAAQAGPLSSQSVRQVRNLSGFTSIHYSLRIQGQLRACDSFHSAAESSDTSADKRFEQWNPNAY